VLPTKIPFQFNSHVELGNGGYPEALPINLWFDDEFAMIRQKGSPELARMLAEIYTAGSMIEGSLSVQSGEGYVDRILRFVDENVGLAGKSLLEIGCGDGTMLLKFADKGASVSGLEPGGHPPNAKLGSLKIVKDFFPSPLITQQFDVVFHYGVLEHIEDVGPFLESAKSALKKFGKLVICVPNCDPFLQTGDISIFVHEHFNYFTPESLIRMLSHFGFSVEAVEVIDGVVAACFSQESSGDQSLLFDRFTKADLAQFAERADRVEANLSQIFETYKESEIAVYVARRAANVLYRLGFNMVRLVDDDPNSRQKFLPGFQLPMENFQDLLETPPACILIYSQTFGEKIRQKCETASELRSSRILTFDDLQTASA
jgi:SAM-dependent methyltransferase